MHKWASNWREGALLAHRRRWGEEPVTTKVRVHDALSVYGRNITSYKFGKRSGPLTHAELMFDGLKALAQVGIFFEFLGDAAARVEHSGVIAVVKEPAQFWEGHFCQFSSQKHGDLPRCDDTFCASAPDDIFGSEVVVFDRGLNDFVHADFARRLLVRAFELSTRDVQGEWPACKPCVAQHT